MEQSLFARFVRLGVPPVQLDAQGRARPSLCELYNWRYKMLGNLPHVLTSPEYQYANPGFCYDYQLINVEDLNGIGESEPTPHFYQVCSHIPSLITSITSQSFNSHITSLITSITSQSFNSHIPSLTTSITSQSFNSHITSLITSITSQSFNSHIPSLITSITSQSFNSHIPSLTTSLRHHPFTSIPSPVTSLLT